MLVSMTGFGHAEISDRTGKVSVEIRTVNHRFLDIAAKLPKPLMDREPEIKDMIKERIARGRVSLTMAAESVVPRYEVSINLTLMEQYMKQLQQFARRHKLEGGVGIDTLAALPEVFSLRENENDADDLWPLAEKAMKQALGACAKMRETEGRALEKDLLARIAIIDRVVKKTEKSAPGALAEHNAAFKERVTKLIDGARIDNDRWMTEIALLADRIDFTEEITRLKSHLSQFRSCVDDGGTVAKRLTYLLQEIHREVTTICSKAADAEIVTAMVSLKEETEKIREQVQNLE
jgi:uncharacterized protein (TIGR00255 family)